MSQVGPMTEGYWQTWFDGSALPNPGDIGVGVVVASPAGVRHERSVLSGNSGCNNEAELSALCLALDLAHELGARRLLVRGDSDVAIRFANGLDSPVSVRLGELVARARASIGRFEEIRLQWVPRHRNGDADRLSRQALGLPDKPALPKSAKRRRRLN
jgi:ribonuclease HI